MHLLRDGGSGEPQQPSFKAEAGSELLALLPDQIFALFSENKACKEWTMGHERSTDAQCSMDCLCGSPITLSGLHLFVLGIVSLNRTSSNKQLRTGWQVPRSCRTLKVISGPMCWRKALKSWSRRRRKGRRKKALQLVKQQRWVSFTCCMCFWITKLTVNTSVN